MEKLADISTFEAVASHGGHATVFNGYLGRLFPKPSLTYKGADSSKPFLGDVGERMALPYEYRLNPNGKVNREKAAEEYNRARGPGRTIRSILEGIKAVIDNYIKHVAPETAFVKQAISSQTADLVQYISFLKEPVVKKRLGLSSDNFDDIERLTVAYIEDSQDKIRNQIINPLNTITTTVSEAVAGGKHGSAVYQIVPDWITDGIDSMLYRWSLRGRSKETKQRLIKERQDKLAQLRAEAESLLLGNYGNTFAGHDLGLIKEKTGINKHDGSPYQYKAVEFPSMDESPDAVKHAATFLGDLSGKAREFGRFVQSTDGKENGLLGYLQANGGTQLLNDLWSYLDSTQNNLKKDDKLPNAVYRYLEAIKKFRETQGKKDQKGKGKKDKDKTKNK